MSFTISILIACAAAIVAIILVWGLVNMTREGAVNRSQQLMRWRVGMQFVAVCLIMASFYFSKT